MNSEEIYLLFLEESLELLPLIQAGLRELSSNYDRAELNPGILSSTIFDILRLLNALHGGAIQAREAQVKEKETSFELFNLDELQTLIGNLQNCLSTLLNQSAQANGSASEQLWQTYLQLKYSLLTQLSQVPSGKLAILAKGEFLFSLAQFPHQLGLAIGLDNNLQEAIVSQDMIQSLINLELIWDSFDIAEQSTELKHQAEIFSGLGELLELKDLVVIADSVFHSVELSQNNLAVTQLITQRALACWQAVQASLSKGSNNDRGENWCDYLFLTEDRQTAVLTDICSEIKSEQILQTEKFFMWLSGYNIFFLPAQLVLAMVIPKSKQIDIVEDRRILRWNNQNVPLYQLSELLQYNYPLPDYFKLDPSLLILVIQNNAHLTALEIIVEQPLVESWLTLKPSAPILTPPEYVCGCTLWKNDQMKAVIDVEALIACRCYN